MGRDTSDRRWTRAVHSRYRDRRGKTQTAGTWPTEKQAIKAWHNAEASKRRGGNGGKKSFIEYVETDWLPHHVIEWTTSDDYRYRITKYLTSYFGILPLEEILPADVREWVTWMQTEYEVKPATLRKVMNILSAIFSTAFNDELIELHPCKGVKLPPIPKKQFTVVTPEQFDALIHFVPARMRLLVETNIETGARWGELILQL
ncbi:MAG TPA: phage integrase SAM-like domain-containing protein [Candidatus Stackebrandtia excrementipullorum]|nr:phage integrase SAM-like domain-containing protein [Candidatus Stackebrandtia excrementipullorum]